MTFTTNCTKCQKGQNVLFTGLESTVAILGQAFVQDKWTFRIAVLLRGHCHIFVVALYLQQFR